MERCRDGTCCSPERAFLSFAQEALHFHYVAITHPRDCQQDQREQDDLRAQPRGERPQDQPPALQR